MKENIISFDSELHRYIINGELEINTIFLFNSEKIKFILTPHTEGEELLPTEIILKEHKSSDTPYRLSALSLKEIKYVSKFSPEEKSNQYNIETHNLFIYCEEYIEHIPNGLFYDKVEKDENLKVIKVSRRKCLEIPIQYIKGERHMSRMFLPTSSYKQYKTPKDLYIEAQDTIKNFRQMHLTFPNKDDSINLLFGNPCIEIKLKDYEEEL